MVGVCSRNILAIEDHKLEDGTNNEAKVKAALLTINLASKLSISKLHLERDSHICVNAIINGETQVWMINKYIKLIKPNSPPLMISKSFTHIEVIMGWPT